METYSIIPSQHVKPGDFLRLMLGSTPVRLVTFSKSAPLTKRRGTIYDTYLCKCGKRTDWKPGEQNRKVCRECFRKQVREANRRREAKKAHNKGKAFSIRGD